jgi:cytochrome c-type biogenesis protein CcsB
VPVDVGLSQLSDHLVFVAVIGYALAMLAYAADTASARVRVPARKLAQPLPAQLREPAYAGAGADVSEPVVPDSPAPPAPPAQSASAASDGRAGLAGRIAIGLNVVAWALHVAGLATRGLSEHRVPWGNMYEFSLAGALAASTVFLLLLAMRQRIRYLGVLVMLAVVCTLGLAGTVLYTSSGPLVPALNSYWIKIHVTAAIISSGVLTVGSAAAGLYLLAQRYERVVAAGRTPGFSGLARRLPEAATLDRVAYRCIAFAFPIWTFAIIAGAIWAEAAWGRYWGWDPKETWSFITWVVYAGYLHARTTAGWRGNRAAWIAMVGFMCFLFNYFGVNMFIVGLHSYAGI